jgi:hypothetical protein
VHILCDGIQILFIVVITISLLNDMRGRGWEIFLLRQLGFFPKKGCETITHVENFMKKNRRDLAIVCYRLIDTEASLKTIVEEVDKFRINDHA